MVEKDDDESDSDGLTRLFCSNCTKDISESDHIYQCSKFLSKHPEKEYKICRNCYQVS